MFSKPQGLMGLMVLSLVVNCSDHHTNKRHDTVAPAPVQQNCSGVSDGQSTTLTYYSKERALLNETCASLGVQVSGTCEQGQLRIKGEGFPACTETQLQKLSMLASAATVKVDGAPVLLTLEGTDQDGKAIAIDTSLVTFASTNPLVEVSADGHVTAKGAAENVVIRATVKEQTAEVTISAEVETPAVPRKNCEDTKDGEVKAFPRYRAAVVNFLATCETYQATAHCDDGNFVFKPEDSITECRVAKVKEFKVSPATLALKAGQTAAVTAEAIDETDFHGAVAADAIEWSIEAAAVDANKITIAQGTLTLADNLIEDAKATAKYADLESVIALAKTKIEPTTIAFEKPEYLLKAGDVVDFKVNGFAGAKEVPLDLEKLTFESSDATKVAIENRSVKVLTASGNVIITAKYADGTLVAQTKVKIEDTLTLTATPAKTDVISAEKPWIVALTQLTVQGPIKGQTPVISGASSTCSFATYLSQGKWMVDVKVVAGANEVIPAACEAVATIESAAGQKAVQNLKATVQFAELKFEELSGTPVARLSYRLSSNIKITAPTIVPHKIAELTPAACQMKVEQKEGLLEVTLANPLDAGVPFCAAFLTYNLEVDGKKTLKREQITVSPYQSFAASCADTNNKALQKTMKALSEALSIRMQCSLMDEILRKKNAESLFLRREFALSLASHDLTDLTPLARLTGLRELILSDNLKLRDLKPLTHLKSLTRIDLDYTGVEDFSPLYGMNAMQLFYSDKETIACKKSEVTNAPLKQLCTQE